MNDRQRLVLFGTAGAIALMVLFPPYVVLNYLQVAVQSGYGFLFALPTYTSQTATIAATVNFPVLIAQILAALVVSALLYMALGDEKRRP